MPSRAAWRFISRTKHSQLHLRITSASLLKLNDDRFYSVKQLWFFNSWYKSAPKFSASHTAASFPLGNMRAQRRSYSKTLSFCKSSAEVPVVSAALAEMVNIIFFIFNLNRFASSRDTRQVIIFVREAIYSLESAFFA